MMDGIKSVAYHIYVICISAYIYCSQGIEEGNARERVGLNELMY